AVAVAARASEAGGAFPLTWYAVGSLQGSPPAGGVNTGSRNSSIPEGTHIFPSGNSRRSHDTPFFTFVPSEPARARRPGGRARRRRARRGGLWSQTRTAG